MTPVPLRDWTRETRDAFQDHLADLADAGHRTVEAHIAAGGTLGTYAAGWLTARIAAAAAAHAAVLADAATGARILDLPLGDGRWGTGNETVRDYLLALLRAFWQDEATTKSGMTGGSDWRYDLYGPLAAAGLVPPWRDGYGIGYRADGTRHPGDHYRADRLIDAAIVALNPKVVTP